MYATGHAFGDWRVEGLLGHGSTGIILAVRRGGRPAALKVLRLPGQLRPEDLADVSERVALRLLALQTVQHPSVLQLLDHGVDVEALDLWLVMERLHGTTLQTTPPTDPARVLRQLAEGLRALHAGSVLHGDIKPANLYLEPDGRAVLADFALDVAPLEGSSPEGVPLGSPSWLPPEAFDGAAATPAGDVYALAQSIAESVMARPAFPITGKGPGRLMRLAEAKRSSHGVDVGPGAPPGLRALILDATAQDPDARPDAERLARRAAALVHQSR